MGMLIHRLLGRAEKPKRVKRPAPEVAELRAYQESPFGVRLLHSMPVTYRTREEFLLYVGRTLRVSGVDMVRVGSTEYRLDSYGRVFHACMWGRAN